jgi:two-component system CheB/CheR fusion protein
MLTIPADETAIPSELPSCVVGVGASAGGLEALEQLFSEMPPSTGLAFVVVQHLSPDFKSMMDELLARRTRIPITLVEDGMHVEADHIYLIPPRKEMIISDGRLLLRDKGGSPDLPMPIDIFFRSLAQDLGDRAIGIVLSGAGSDGSRGIRDIHEAGGLVICQDETSAAFDSMPRAARETGIVDHVLPPHRMAGALTHYVHARDATGLGGPVSEDRPRGVRMVFRLLQDAYGIDFSHYKPNTVVRRIERRLDIAHTTSLDDYCDRLATDPAELDALYRDLLIGVTRFFRDAEAFAYLEEQVIPELIMRSAADEEVRLWIPGCATGEEPYSMAILLHDYLEKAGLKRRIKIFATDVHTGSLELASRALYREESLERVRPEHLARYFVFEGPNRRVAQEIRELVVFARHNVLKDAPFTRVDMVSCRNMLIYFQPNAQKKALSLMHFALKRDGFLVLGPSESPGSLADDFETLHAHWRIYKKRRDRPLHHDARIPLPRAPELAAIGPFAGQPYTLGQTIGIYDSLLAEHMPPSFLVNERRELIHTFGGAGSLLAMRDGRPSKDLLDMVESDLKMALTGALQRVLKDRTPVVYTSLGLTLGGEKRRCRLTVKPVLSKGGAAPHLLVSIEQLDGGVPAAAGETELDPKQMSSERLGMLELELRQTKENLQATIEELETSNEELQATNEEMLASNEELQSTNEELQSVNEELYTVNAEYQKKIAQLSELTIDVDNLLLSTDVGAMFLDRQLCIRKFTPRVGTVFNLLPQDVGRPISGFTNTLNHPTLGEELAAVLNDEKPIEREVRDRAGTWYFLRILPYRARGSTDGVVLTLIDINGLKNAESALFHERHLLENLTQNVPDGIYFKDTSGRFVRINQAMAKRLGVANPSDAAGKRAADFLPPAQARELDEADEQALGGAAQPYRHERHLLPNGEVAWYLSTRQPLRDRDGKVVGMFGVVRDVTEQKLADDEVRLAITRRDQFLAMLSHELRNPLGAIVCAAKLLSHGETAVNRHVGVIERQSRHMARLLDDLLEVNRVTQNKVQLERRAYDVRKAVEEAASALDSTFKARGVSLALELGARPAIVHGDPARLQQIVVNLLGNAAKYSEQGSQVTARVAHDGDEITIVVVDEGAGIDPQVLPTIFDLFVQGNATLARTDGGMGVGLALVRALTEMHDGTVTAESDGVGKGSTFVVRLPITSSRDEVVAPARRSINWRVGHHVALVDDNVDNCAMLEEVFKSAGYRVCSAHDGADGLELIQRERPDIAIIDIGLPRLNGYDVARTLRAERENDGLYLVALTGYGQPADREAAIAAGFDEHLVKPLHPEDLDVLIRRRPLAGEEEPSN